MNARIEFAKLRFTEHLADRRHFDRPVEFAEGKDLLGVRHTASSNAVPATAPGSRISARFRQHRAFQESARA